MHNNSPTPFGAQKSSQEMLGYPHLLGGGGQCRGGHKLWAGHGGLQQKLWGEILGVHLLDVFLEVTLLGRAVRAEGAHEGLLPRVGAEVPFVVALVAEGLRAIRAVDQPRN